MIKVMSELEFVVDQELVLFCRAVRLLQRCACWWRLRIAPDVSTLIFRVAAFASPVALN